MYRTALFVLALALPASATAQDIAPVISPGQAAEGIFHRSVAEGQARRIREGRSTGSSGYAVRPGTTAQQARACYSRPNLRAKYGADHPKVLKLDSLCEQAGY
ncbi:hypothetical protein U5A82_19425 [Sphingobium sp. CR2-8]|uniref:hypothetical protein n=1 Tax=Sphingobium sp. CR2-8 TaxID=1306534 RepID=UPI002DB9EA60|nr:hypothetical protein [Sphingobium sp. CR2-8]MEC3912564.1 hypothetical protein [Sphingobium sp. CR2-8]